jgi:hypothetical protein
VAHTAVGGGTSWAGAMFCTVPSLEVAVAVWSCGGSAVVGLAGISACCDRGSLVCGRLVVGFSAIEAVAGSSGDVADEAMLGWGGGTTGSAVRGSIGAIRSADETA